MNRLLAALALVAFIAALAAVVIVSTGDNGTSSAAATTTTATVQATTTTTTQATTTVALPGTQFVKLTGVGAYDPEGDQHENDDLAPLAVDGDATTFWKTEHYTNGFFKKGVGLLLDMGRRQTLSRVTVGTDAAGSSAQIEVGSEPTGPFRTVSTNRPLTGTTAFRLARGAAGRYLVVWITSMPRATGEAHITEVRAIAGGA